jgi:hypothetical protein
MLKSLVYSLNPIIEKNIGNWHYDIPKCSWNLMHTWRSAGCIQGANDNYDTADRFNIAIWEQGIVPYWLDTGNELCYSWYWWCDFEFYLK